MDNTATEIKFDEVTAALEIPAPDAQQELTSAVCEIVAEVLGLDEAVQPEQTFQELGADSIDLATLAVTLQDEFPDDQPIDEKTMTSLRSPADVVRLLEQK